MRDMHSHILPGVDDGARDLETSLAMIDAARAAGVTSIVCTPHARDPYFDFEGMWSSFKELSAHTDMPLSMGFEVAHEKLLELGVRAWGERLAFEGTGEFLLELDPGCRSSRFREYERTIYQLQGLGLTVIIAHPERYRAIQRDLSLAERLVDLGCELQVSADFISGGRFGRERRPARKLIARGLCSYVASDAHYVEHYRQLAQTLREYPQFGGDGGVT